MAAFTGTPASANSYARQQDSRKAQGFDVDGQMQMADSGLYTHVLGAGTGEINLFTLPAGRIAVYPDLCRVVATQFAVNADLHIGARAYVDDATGLTVAEDDNLFTDNVDVGGGAIDAVLTLPAAGYHEFNSRFGVTIYAMVDTANIEDTDTLRLHMAYKRLR